MDSVVDLSEFQIEPTKEQKSWLRGIKRRANKFAERNGIDVRVTDITLHQEGDVQYAYVVLRVSGTDNVGVPIVHGGRLNIVETGVFAVISGGAFGLFDTVSLAMTAAMLGGVPNDVHAVVAPVYTGVMLGIFEAGEVCGQIQRAARDYEAFKKILEDKEA